MDALAHRLPRAAEITGLSRSKLYELIASGKIEARKVGGTTVILHDELVRYLATTPVAEIGGGHAA